MTNLFSILTVVLALIFGTNSSKIQLNKEVDEERSNLADSKMEIFQSNDGGDTWEDANLIKLPDSISVRNAMINEKEITISDQYANVYTLEYKTQNKWVKQDIDWMKMSNDFLGKVLVKRNIFMSMFKGQKGNYFNMYQNGVYQKNHDTDKWVAWVSPMTNNNIHHILELDNEDLIVSTQNGIFKSIDSGHSWKQVYSSSSVSNLSNFNKILVASSQRGLLYSSDQGNTWITSMSTFDVNYQTRNLKNGFCAIKTGGYDQPFSLTVPALISTNGKDWKNLNTNQILGERFIDLLQTDKYFFINHSGGISRSSDNGETWELIYSTKDLKKNMQYDIQIFENQVFILPILGGC